MNVVGSLRVVGVVNMCVVVGVNAGVYPVYVGAFECGCGRFRRCRHRCEGMIRYGYGCGWVFGFG